MTHYFLHIYFRNLAKHLDLTKLFMIRAVVLILVIPFLAWNSSKAQSLDYFLDHGLKNSPLLKDYQNQIRLSSMDSSLIAAAQKPQIDVNGGLYVAPAFHNNTYGYDPTVTNGGNYTATIGVQQTIFNRKTLSTKYAVLQLQRQSLQNSQALSSNELKRVITNLYLTLCADNSNIVFNQQFLTNMQLEQKLLKELVAHGIYKQTDYLSFSIQVQGQEILLHQLEAQMKRDLHVIYGACGITDTVGQQVTFPIITRKEQTDLSLSPLFLQYKLDSLRLINERSLVDVRYHPKISWMADAGFLSATLGSVYQHAGFSAGVNITIPLYDGNQKKLEYQKLSISEETRSSYANFFKNQYGQQVAQIQEDLSVNKSVMEQLSAQLHDIGELIQLTESQLNHGNMSITDYILASENYITINFSLTQAKIKELTLINELNYLMQ